MELLAAAAAAPISDEFRSPDPLLFKATLIQSTRPLGLRLSIDREERRRETST